MWWDKKENNKFPKIDWDNVSNKGKDFKFKGKIFGIKVNISPKRIKNIAFVISILIVILFFRNIYYLFVPLQLPSHKTSVVVDYIDDHKLMNDTNLVKIGNIEISDSISSLMKNNKLLRRAAYDSLIDNNVLTPESYNKLDELYPDSLCGC